MDKIWQVWTENTEESEKQGHLVDQKILFSGTNKMAHDFYKIFGGAKKGLHIGYETGGEE